MFRDHVPVIVDARKRLLAASGRLIPQQDRLWAALVESQTDYQQLSDPWEQRVHDFDLNAGKRLVRNSWTKVKRTTFDQLLTPPECWAALDYRTINNADVNGKTTSSVIREGVAHGICVWFDSTLWGDIGLSNAPDAPQLIYGNAFFPLSEPVQVAKGDLVRLAISADLVGEDYVWRWNTAIHERRDARAIKADFAQSTFFGAPLSPARLQKRAAGYIPRLNEEGELDGFVLKHMNGKVSSEEVARQLRQTFPDRFASDLEALTRIGELVQKYSR